MLTKNFYQYLGTQIERFDSETHEWIAHLVNYDGFAFDKAYKYNTAAPRAWLGSMINPKVTYLGSDGTWFGKGTTPPTPDDYTLEAPYVNGEFRVQCASAVTATHTEESYSVSIVYNITNTTSADLTISEIGVFSRHVSTGQYYCLLDHTVLENPVVIPAGRTVAMEYVIKFPYGN